jgi:hypothetical protein
LAQLREKAGDWQAVAGLALLAIPLRVLKYRRE